MQRRKFVSSIGVLGTAMATGVARPIGANEKVGIALIGARNMGWNDLASAMHTGGAKVVAIVDVDNSKGAQEIAKRNLTPNPTFTPTTGRFLKGKT